jgi:hypothetical protein
MLTDYYHAYSGRKSYAEWWINPYDPFNANSIISLIAERRMAHRCNSQRKQIHFRQRHSGKRGTDMSGK